MYYVFFFFFQAEDGIRDWSVTGVQTCALPISLHQHHAPYGWKLLGDGGFQFPAFGMRYRAGELATAAGHAMIAMENQDAPEPPLSWYIVGARSSAFRLRSGGPKTPRPPFSMSLLKRKRPPVSRST